MSLCCNFILFFLVANELWIKAKVQEKNKTWKFPRLATRPYLSNDWLTGWTTNSWLPVCWEETVRFTSRPSSFWIVCQELFFIQMSIHSKRKLWLHLTLFGERGGWFRSFMQEIIPRWVKCHISKVRFHNSNAFIELSECDWNFIVLRCQFSSDYFTNLSTLPLIGAEDGSFS